MNYNILHDRTNAHRKSTNYTLINQQNIGQTLVIVFFKERL